MVLLAVWRHSSAQNSKEYLLFWHNSLLGIKVTPPALPKNTPTSFNIPWICKAWERLLMREHFGDCKSEAVWSYFSLLPPQTQIIPQSSVKKGKGALQISLILQVNPIIFSPFLLPKSWNYYMKFWCQVQVVFEKVTCLSYSLQLRKKCSW